MPGDEVSFAAPGTLADALGELSDEGSIAVGGGTSVAILLKSRLLDARRLVYLGRVPGLSGVGERAVPGNGRARSGLGRR